MEETDDESEQESEGGAVAGAQDGVLGEYVEVEQGPGALPVGDDGGSYHEAGEQRVGEGQQSLVRARAPDEGVGQACRAPAHLGDRSQNAPASSYSLNEIASNLVSRNNWIIIARPRDDHLTGDDADCGPHCVYVCVCGCMCAYT